jgi:hypothetical protein
VFNRRSTDTFAGSMTDRVRRTLDGLDNHLSRLGRIGSTAALTAMAVAAAVPLHFLVASPRACRFNPWRSSTPPSRSR